MHVGEVGDKVVADQEAHHDPVVDDALQVVKVQHLQLLELVVQVLSDRTKIFRISIPTSESLTSRLKCNCEGVNL